MSNEIEVVEAKVLKWISKHIKECYQKSIGVPCPYTPRHKSVVLVFMGERTWAEACIEVIDTALQGLASRGVKLDDTQVKLVRQRKQGLIDAYAYHYKPGDELQ